MRRATPRAPSSAARRAPRVRTALAALLPAALLAAGCGAGAVRVPVPTPDAATARLCAGLRLPEKVLGHERRDTTPESPLTAAWGSPAIALRCGVPRPPELRPDSQLMTINGVDWFGVPVDRPVTFTAVARQAYVEVTVPAAYTPPGDVLIELGAAIAATIPKKPEGQI
ncbi:hypothetical protein Arub01_08150 [Actinomadura rubrobrunea]|uniref:DUF3515 domain-containing protein n=1 Tax=Actinomadura rubrobrunea TaxID=115335 RepID=A0A9W6PT82_9ACTN|nr:DUF3515 domain-containing protein [Actinomadura rubrobrunea]GLW62571.1 hypothetical protein Arub01_08150 [Actinomadura rubrobrunea]